jgi:hypothetical protein
MSDSGESVDHEVEVRVPESVDFFESGQGDVRNDQKFQEDETEDRDFSPRSNPLRGLTPPLEGSHLYPGQRAIVPVPNFQTLGASFNMKPEPFSGRESWEEYLSHFEDCAELSQWSDKQKVLFLAASLRDQARSYYMSLSQVERRSYESLINRFNQRFGSSKFPNKWLSRLDARKRQPGETVTALGDDIRQMSQKAYCNLDERSQEALALNHLYKIIPVEMKIRCFDRDCNSITDAVGIIEKYEALLGENGDKKKQNVRAVSYSDNKDANSENRPMIPNLVNNQREESDTNRALQEISSRLERLERDSRKSSKRRCYQCNSISHFIKDCPLLDRNNPHSQAAQRRDQEPSTPKSGSRQGNGKPSAR